MQNAITGLGVAASVILGLVQASTNVLDKHPAPVVQSAPVQLAAAGPMMSCPACGGSGHNATGGKCDRCHGARTVPVSPKFGQESPDDAPDEIPEAPPEVQPVTKADLDAFATSINSKLDEQGARIKAVEEKLVAKDSAKVLAAANQAAADVVKPSQAKPAGKPAGNSDLDMVVIDENTPADSKLLRNPAMPAHAAGEVWKGDDGKWHSLTHEPCEVVFESLVNRWTVAPLEGELPGLEAYGASVKQSAATSYGVSGGCATGQCGTSFSRRRGR